MQQKIANWMKQPESMGADALMYLPTLMEKYPYCATYRLLYTIALANTHSTRLNEELRRTATMLPNSEKLFTLINNGEFEWIRLMIDLQQKKSQKMDSVDSFMLIDQYLQQNEVGIDSMLSTDYNLDDIDDDFSEMMDENGEGDDSFDLIDSFIEADQQGKLFVPKADQMQEEQTETEPQNIREKAFLTESLAKLYVKQHKYEQALSIFSSLNLDNSKKNSYFADQIRYLEKIIAHQSAIKSNKDI